MSALDNQPENANFLSPLGFRFIVDKLPNVNYFCQSAGPPAVALTELSLPNPLLNLPFAGTKLDYSPFDIRFRVDEDMKNYLEIYDWLVGLGTLKIQISIRILTGVRPTSAVSKINQVNGVYSDDISCYDKFTNPNKRGGYRHLSTNLFRQFDVTG